MTWGDHIACKDDPKVIRKNKLSEYIETQQKIIKSLREKRDKSVNKLIRQDIVKEIAEKVEELKPYIKERSNITKTLSKNVMCAERHYRFLKEPKGVIPTILQNLLDARANTRVEIKKHKKEIELLTDQDKINELKLLNNVLDKRQLAYKISSNSMYGAWGVKKGYLPFMPGAMATTYMGRTNIEIVADTIQKKYKGELVYGDTDSNYIHFEHLKTAQESWDYALKVADEVSALFPPPIKLDFESIIYEKFCILTKKRYMYKSCGRDGIVDEKIGKKGVLLARRDCSVFIRNLYEQIIKFVFDSTKLDDMLYYIIEQLNNLCSNNLDKKNFVITKAVGDTGGMQLVPFTNEKGVRKVKVGSYILPLLPKDKEERESQLAKKDVTNEKDYYKKCLPAVVQLAEKMRNRGMRVDNGSRLEYVITDTYNKNDKQYDKLESIDYFNNHSDILKIDFMYYLKLLINPLDEVLNIVYKDDPKFKKDFIAEQYKIRNNRIKVLNDIKGLFEPKIQFV